MRIRVNQKSVIELFVGHILTCRKLTPTIARHTLFSINSYESYECNANNRRSIPAGGAHKEIEQQYAAVTNGDRQQTNRTVGRFLGLMFVFRGQIPVTLNFGFNCPRICHEWNMSTEKAFAARGHGVPRRRHRREMISGTFGQL
jgi:hypothetical protein